MPRNNKLKQKHRKLPHIITALQQLLLAGAISTQEDIRQALHQQGYEVNQSKISRLLRKIGAIKTTNDRKQIIYSLPHEPAPPAAKNVLSQLITNITANENLIVVRTNPGSASLIGRLLDHHQQELEILGTVAGDDTILVVPKSVKQITKILRAIKHLVLNSNDKQR